jgi:hypothetical protein
MRGRSPEPEWELARRVVPFGAPAAVVALLLGWVAGGWGTGWSAAIGVTVVALNSLLSGLSVARAARVSVTMLFAVSAIGIFVRLGAIVAIMFFLDTFAFFSPLAFGLAVVPATLLLLGYEMKLMAGGLGQELRIPNREEGATSP